MIAGKGCVGPIFSPIVFRYCVEQGVTFLALGNGAPDVFSAMAAFSHPQTAGLAVGALFGERSDLLNIHPHTHIKDMCWSINI